MDRIFYTEREWYPSTEKLVRKIFASRYAIKDAEIERGETGKPFLRGTPYFFSVTHSDRMYFIAVSDINVGIDAEPMDRKVDYEKILLRFPPEERAEIRNREDFLRHWTARESAVKWTGGTLKDAFFHFSFVGGKLFFRDLELPLLLSHYEREGHILALCREKSSAPPEFIRV